MRIHIKIQVPDVIIPFDHQPLLVGTIHKWLGWNKEHGKLSLYSFSRLEGGKAVNGGLKFPKETSFFFSSYDIDLIKRLVNSIQTDPFLFFSLKVTEIILQEDPELSERELFWIGSPVFIKRRDGNSIKHILYSDLQSSDCLKETLQTKMKEAGLTDDSFEVYFDTNYSKPRTQKINYNGIENKVNWCPVIIKGKPETKLFAWNVGLGNSTGIGFGAIK
jgi:CRISPR-associated endoribonuclease Cas6